MPAGKFVRRARRAARVLGAILVLALILSACPAHAQALRPFWRLRRPNPAHPHVRRAPAGVVDPNALALLQIMLQAKRTLTVSGTQVTTLYQGNRAVTSVQTITTNGDRAYRMDYQGPSALAGQVVVDNGQVEWHYFPERKTMEVTPSELGNLRERIGPVLNALRRRRLNAVVVGQDQVAGHAAEVVEVSGIGTYAGARRFWIDPTNGAELRIDIYGPAGGVISTSYYTQVIYSPSLTHSSFNPPDVPADTRITAGITGQTLPGMPTDLQAGFHVLAPAYLPPGFRFESASQSNVGGEPLIGLQYGDGVESLSLYESPLRRLQPNKIMHPRADVLIVRQNGIRLILIGNLARKDLEQIAQSLR